MNQHTVAAFEAIDHYLDDLMCELPSDASVTVSMPEYDDEWPPSTTEYLLCTAAKIQVAIPMTQIEEILQAPLEDAGAFVPDSGQRLQVRDLSRILADDLQEPQADTVVVLNGWRWALACHVSDHEPCAIAAADVQWRGSRSSRARRAWLGGLRKSDDCVLLDAVMLQEMLDKQRGVAA